MDGEQWSRLVGWTVPWTPDSGENLGKAWARCPDVRWMLASAVETGVDPRKRTAAVIACVRALFPALEQTSAGRAVLEPAEAYATRRLDGEELAAKLPRIDERAIEGEIVPGLVQVLQEGLGERFMDEVPKLPIIAALDLLRVLRPETAAHDRSRAVVRLCGFLASVRALAARAEARAEGLALTQEQVSALGGASAQVISAVPPESSPAWDDAAARAYAQALSEGAERVRAVLPAPG